MASTYRGIYAIRDFMPHSASFFNEALSSPAAMRIMGLIESYCKTPYAQGDHACPCLNNPQLLRSAFGLPADSDVVHSPYAAIVSTAPCYAEQCLPLRGQQPPTYLSQITCLSQITICSMLNSGSVSGSAISLMCGNIETDPGKIETVHKQPVPATNGLSTGWIVGIIVACVGVVLGVGIYWRRRTKVATSSPRT